MFTGLVETLGKVVRTSPEGAGRRLTITTPFAGELSLGESVACNGCCLTVVDRDATSADFQAGPETLQRTNLGKLRVGDPINLERAVRPADRLGGHLVQGHIDGTGTVKRRIKKEDWEVFWFEIGSLAQLLVPKGSVAVDGVSLTVVEVTGESFSVALIPHTLKVTTLGNRAVGDTVNVETDLIGKYVYKFLHQTEAGLSVDALRAAGFVS